MKNISGCGKIVVGLLLVFGLVAIVVILVLNYISYRQKQLRIRYTPPRIQITEPAADTIAFTGSYVTVSATATGTRPIVRVELWLDDQLLETQNSEQPEGHSPFYSNFSVLIPSDGAHLLFVRAINSDGLMDQSLGVSLTGIPKDGSLSSVTVKEGESLEDIANVNGISPGTLQGMNPGVGSQPATGTQIKLPPKAGGGKPANPPVVIPPGVPMLPNDPGKFLVSDKPMILFSPIITAPSNLQAGYKDCKVTLRWNDNTQNEMGYAIYMIPVNFGGLRWPYITLEASPGTGPAWNEFDPLATGTFTVWVTAVDGFNNEYYSNIVSIYIPFTAGCSHSEDRAKALKITVTDITVNANVNNVYCYMYFENGPEYHRVPPDKNIFIPLTGGQSPPGQVLALYTIHIPDDKVFDLTGECWGWAGTPQPLGWFNFKSAYETWNGKRQVVQGDKYQIGIELLAMPQGRQDTIAATDPTLPTPYGLFREDRSEMAKAFYNVDTPLQQLLWKWDGDQSKIDDFVIFINGEPADSSRLSKCFGPGCHGEYSYLFSADNCGETFRFQVAARSGSTISDLSNAVFYTPPQCPMYLTVNFNTLELDRTDDGWSSGPDACEGLSVYFAFRVREKIHGFLFKDNPTDMYCGKYDLAKLVSGQQKYGPRPHVITIPLKDGEDIHSIKIVALFWDQDDAGDDDPVGEFIEHPLQAPAYAKTGQRWDRCLVEVTTDTYVTDEASARLKYSYSFYPNKCRDFPP